MKYQLLCFLACGALISNASTTAATVANAADDHLRWFDDARFGMFVHWGVYAVPAGIWQGKPVPGIGEWIMKNGQIPVADYRAFAKDFTASKYDPEAWAKLAKEAGMKYVVITSKHHDGFALYDSKASDWNAVKASGARRDLLVPLAKAVRAEGLKFGLYYSQSQDWNNSGGGKAGGGKDWDPAQAGDYDKYLQTVALPQVKEIVEAYDPAILWWDTPVEMTEERVQPFADYMAGHPNIVNNDRLGQGFKGDTKTPEQHIPPRGYPGERFEVCMTMNDTWGYKKDDQNWKSVRQLLWNLSDISSKGGNFLLNVGPTPEGVIPPESVERLQAIGRWMKVNGEAIHGTQAGPFPRRQPWGRVTMKQNSEVGTTLYAHVWEWPANGRILLPALQNFPASARLLANGQPVKAEKTAEGVELVLPGEAPDPDVSVVRIDFPRAVTVTQEPFITPDQSGRLVFTPQDADANGSYDGNIQFKNAGPDAFLTDWKNPKWNLEYHMKTPAAGKWTVAAEVATGHPAKLNIEADNDSTPAEVASTGEGMGWKTVTLGTISLPAGEASFSIKPVADGWQGLSLRNVILTPDKSQP
jgi:alpha-L-fucosidase